MPVPWMCSNHPIENDFCEAEENAKRKRIITEGERMRDKNRKMSKKRENNVREKGTV